MNRNWIVAAILLLLIVGALYQEVSEHMRTPIIASAAPEIGRLAPSATLEALDGKSYRIGGPRDKPLLVNFWASWCGPCKQEAPDLQALYETYQDQIDFYGVNVTSLDMLPDIEAFVEEYHLSFPILLDPEDHARALYQLRTIPTSFIIDKNGTIADIILIMEYQELEQKILNIISPQGPMTANNPYTNRAAT